MSERAIAFVEDFVSPYTPDVGYEVTLDWSEANTYAELCFVPAATKGIRRSEIEEEFGDLVARMSIAMGKM